MKKTAFLALLITLLASSSCKKAVEAAAEDYFVAIVTEGTWRMTFFFEGPTDYTTDFAPYTFKFNKDFSFIASRTGFPDKVGTWGGSVTSQTIEANFPGETGILKKISNIFKTTSVVLGKVKASRTEAGVESRLFIEKN